MKKSKSIYGVIQLGFLLLGAVAFCVASGVAWAQEPLKVGEKYAIHVDSSGLSDVEVISTAKGLRYEISHPGATYMAVHFKKFHLAPGDTLIVSDADGGQSYVLADKGKMNAGKFWSQHVKGDTIVLELVSTGQQPGKGFVIDEYAAGFVELGGRAIEAICGANDLENAICRVGSTEYEKARAVARLLIQGRWLCTGWLASANNHLITNEHCISSETEALNTDYEFMAEAPNCNDPNCQLCYTGDIYSGSSFIQDNAALDYALVQLAGNPSATYGYLQIDNREAVVDEQIYIPQHPAGRAKEFGFVSTYPTDTDGVCRVYSTTWSPCTGSSYFDVGYTCDTEGGSSGSPVLATSSHKVIALHHCSYEDCQGPNLGVPIDLICDEIAADIPSCDEGYCGDGTCDAGEDQCNCPDDCGTPPSDETGLCTDGINNDCDTYTDCDDSDCASDPACICDDDDTCEPGEDCNNCPGDCISGGGTPGCGNGTCEPEEDCNNCPDDCRAKTTGAPQTRYCCDSKFVDCGNPKCSEDGWSCGSVDPYCCGDGICEGAETVCNCYDCGTPPPNEVPTLTCQDGFDNDCDNFTDCDDSDCDSDPACVCTPNGESCLIDEDCCSQKCRRGACR